MRYLRVLIAVGMLLPCAAWAQKQMYAIPVQKDVPVYQNRIRKVYEKPLFVMEEQGRYVVVEKAKDALKVQDGDRKAGWVEKGKVKTVLENKEFSFDAVQVQPWIDNPQLVVIIDGNDPSAKPIVLERSFADALRENVDQETINRQVN
ncbi:MAG TPA: hypothetical protein VLX68_03070 [Chitinivibrionales bacterium]|nr:hypothetical protein [Chitinivibrionales bacterium]